MTEENKPSPKCIPVCIHLSTSSEFGNFQRSASVNHKLFEFRVKYEVSVSGRKSTSY